MARGMSPLALRVLDRRRAFCVCSGMDRRTPLGGTHARDFKPMRQQAPLSELTAGEDGYVRFSCSRCPRTGKIRLAELHARFAPEAGLVNVLNTVAPRDCGRRSRKHAGDPGCGWYYRDLGKG